MATGSFGKLTINNRSSSRVYLLIFLVLGFIGVILVLLGTSRYGIGISPDSVNYIAAARSLLAGDGFLRYDGTPYVEWPPLFPTILAALGLFGIDPSVSVRFVNALIFGMIIYVFGRILLRYLISKPLALLGALSVTLSPLLLSISAMAFTEPLFVLLALLYFIQLGKFRKDKRFSDLLLLAAVGAFLCLLRYIGVIVVLAGFVIVIHLNTESLRRPRIKQAVILTLISGVPLVIWLLRNYLLTSTLTGARTLKTPSLSIMMDNIIAAVNTMTIWFLPERIPSVPRLAVVFIIAATLMASYFFAGRAGRRRTKRQILIRFACLLILLDVLALTFIATWSVVDPVGNRLLLTTFIFVMFLIFVGLDHFSVSLERYLKNGRLAIAIVISLCSLGLTLSGIRAYEGLLSRVENGAGVFSSTVWRESALINSLRMQPLAGRVFSNAADAIYILTDQTAYLSPNRALPIAEFRKSTVVANNDYLVWFNQMERTHLHSLPELQKMLVLETVREYDDGGIYQFK